MTDLSTTTLLELDSFRDATPVPKAGVRWVTDLDEAQLGEPVMLVPYAIANEHVGLHAVLVDRPLEDYGSARAVTRGLAARAVSLHRSDDIAGITRSWARGDALFIATWDGRDPDGRRSTMRALATLLGPRFTDPERPPRLLVPTRADWSLVRDAIRWELPLRQRFHDPQIERFAMQAHWWVERAKVPGQQSVIVVAEHLREAWQVPLEPDDQLHLGAVLACFGPAAGDQKALLRAVRLEETRPAGPRSLPKFDNEQFLVALGAVGRPAGHPEWDAAITLLWDHVAHRRDHLHRAVRILFADAALPAAPSIAATAVQSKPGLIDLERRQWADHVGRRTEVEAAHAVYAAAHTAHGPDDPQTDRARRDAQSFRNFKLPRHLATYRFSDMAGLSDALDVLRVVEDRYARAEARRRGVCLPGQVTAAPSPVPDTAVLHSGKWKQNFVFSFNVRVPGARPLGRFRPGKEISFGPPGLAELGGTIRQGVVSMVEHAGRRVTITYTRTATSTVGVHRIRVPNPLVQNGADIELLPNCRFAKLADRFNPVGPRPITHSRGTGGAPITLPAATAAGIPLPKDLR